MRFPFGLVIIFISWIISANMKQKKRNPSKQDFSSEQNTFKNPIWHKSEDVLEEVFSELGELKEQFFGESDNEVLAKKENLSKQETAQKNSSELMKKDKEVKLKRNAERNNPSLEEYDLHKQKKSGTSARKRTRLQKAIIYSEVIGKPKALR